ncbi:16S rRNA (cytosine(967)-C(5))-methyltransferase RsmB [Chlorobium phaeobacteroides]|uniref:16S rRNA (cytosine(967)-C(5))-methyltransferase n=1 Tax=Chlorobium phaeobacteroides (strain DSM 266 / SMG 266 / 2430) TaxID=290317 RepID=A1BHA8_CHLPD|nr:16S rRNA (cytosine(967)-C(5))-methyltransferase RsmB [Chlorobium phaeobacteroides]ABL65785.1 sun protein [Chlorobium phaeobacteroides DSM 266]
MNAREAALKALQAIEPGKEKSDRIVHAILDRATMNRQDRALTTELVNGVLRMRKKIDFIISKFYHHRFEKAAPVLQNILRLGVYQLLFLEKIPEWAAVSECVDLARKYKGERMAKLVNGVLRKITPDNVVMDEWLKGCEDMERLSVQYSHPEWLINRWNAVYGRETTLASMTYNNHAPLFGFRINTLKQTPDEFLADPAHSSFPQERCLTGNFFLSKEFAGFEACLKSGKLTVQNPTQGVACLLLNPVPESRVLDLCAAPGGKATFMAELMQNKGSITAVDRSSEKLEKTRQHAVELGITIIKTICADARSFVPEETPQAVLLDAPCTGTGVLQKRAELRWKLSMEMLQELVTLQRELLDHAASILPVNGILLYATCSIEPEENELQIEAFLRRHPEFSRDTSCGSLPEPFRMSAAEKGSILTLPGELPGFDGGFAQRLRKNAR